MNKERSVRVKKVLFVTYGGGHVNMVVPVVKKLMTRADIDVHVLGMTTARQVLEQQAIPCFSFRDLPMNDQAINYGKKLVEELGGNSAVPYAESIAYMGLSYQCLVQEHGEREAAELYTKLGRHAFLPVTVMEELIREGAYDLVVATNSPRSERAAILAAGRLGVPSICIVDLFATQGVKWLGQPGYATKVCVLCDEVKHLLCEAGRSLDEIVVTGNPAFDRLADPRFHQQGQVLRKKRGWENKKVVLWCSQNEPNIHPFTSEKGDPSLPFQIEQQLQQACEKHKKENWHLFVRPHPSENLAQRKILPGVEYGQKDELTALLHAVDTVVVTSSTVGLEAALLEKPVIALNMSIFSKDMPYADMGLAVGVDSLAEVEAVIEKVFSHTAAVEVQLPPAGSAAEKIAGLICSMLEDKQESICLN